MSDLVHTLGKRLVELRGDASQKEFAKQLGVHFNTLAAYERGEGSPDLRFLTKISELSGKGVSWLIGAGDNGVASLPSGVDADGVQIPRFDVRAAAGAGTLALTENVSSYFTVDRDWLRRALPSWAGANASVGILEGSGDSMEPTIRDGDLIMAVRNPPEYAIDRGGVFLVLHHGQLRIKRLHVDMASGDISLISDNPRYPPERVPKDRVEFDLQVLALIFFAGGRLRT